jgi:hypothetical protein
MKILFDLGLDDLCEAQFRSLKYSVNYRQDRKIGSRNSVKFFMMAYLSLYIFSDINNIKLIAVTLVLYSIYSLVHTLNYDTDLRKILKKSNLKEFGPENRKVEYEITDEALIYREDYEVKYLWGMIESVALNKGHIEIWVTNSGMFLQPKKMFQSEFERNKWLYLLICNLKKSKNQSPPRTCKSRIPRYS